MHARLLKLIDQDKKVEEFQNALGDAMGQGFMFNQALESDGKLLKEMTLLNYAVSKKRLETVGYLLSLEAHVGIQTQDGEIAIDLAWQSYQRSHSDADLKMFKLLIAPTWKLLLEGGEELDDEMVNSIFKKLVARLKELKLSLDYPINEAGDTVLLQAVRFRNLHLVIELLSEGASSTVPNKKSETASHLAAKLLKANPDDAVIANISILINQQIIKQQLVEAINKGSLRDVKKLLQKKQCGINISLDSDENSPLLLALKKQKKEIAAYLLEAGASVTYKNKAKQNASEVANFVAADDEHFGSVAADIAVYAEFAESMDKSLASAKNRIGGDLATYKGTLSLQDQKKKTILSLMKKHLDSPEMKELNVYQKLDLYITLKVIYKILKTKNVSETALQNFFKARERAIQNTNLDYCYFDGAANAICMQVAKEFFAATNSLNVLLSDATTQDRNVPWLEPIMGTNDLPEAHTWFRTAKNEIHDYASVVEQAISALKERQIKLANIWHGTDSKEVNAAGNRKVSVLTESDLAIISQRTPTIGKLVRYTYAIDSYESDSGDYITPFINLRDALLAADKEHGGTEEGMSEEAAAKLDNVLLEFSEWWNKIPEATQDKIRELRSGFSDFEQGIENPTMGGVLNVLLADSAREGESVFDVVLLSVKPGDKLDLKKLLELSKQNNNYPVLVKQGSKVSVFGVLKSEHEVTELDSSVFNKIKFPDLGKSSTLQRKRFTKEQLTEISKGHAPMSLVYCAHNKGKMLEGLLRGSKVLEALQKLSTRKPPQVKDEILDQWKADIEQELENDKSLSFIMETPFISLSKFKSGLDVLGAGQLNYENLLELKKKGDAFIKDKSAWAPDVNETSIPGQPVGKKQDEPVKVAEEPKKGNVPAQVVAEQKEENVVQHKKGEDVPVQAAVEQKKEEDVPVQVAEEPKKEDVPAQVVVEPKKNNVLSQAEPKKPVVAKPKQPSMPAPSKVVPKPQDPKKLALEEVTKFLNTLGGTPKTKYKDTTAIVKFIFDAKSNNNLVLGFLHSSLLEEDFDYLREHNFLSRYYGMFNGERSKTSHSWAQIERAFSLQLVKNTVDTHAAINRDTALDKLYTEHDFIKNNRKYQFHPCTESHTSRLFANAKKVKEDTGTLKKKMNQLKSQLKLR